MRQTRPSTAALLLLYGFGILGHMKNVLLTLGVCGAVALGVWGIYGGDAGTTDQAISPNDLVFYADEGVRMESASNPGVRLNDDGSLDLLFEDKSVRSSLIATAQASSDWLDFTVTERNADVGVFRAHKLPDGTCRAYGYDLTKGNEGAFTSRSAADCAIFARDVGTRYTLQDDDGERSGVYDFFNDAQGGVVMLYLGDLMGSNNVRRAYSTDNGETFTFTNGNVFGDDDAGGGPNSYVDEKVIELPGGAFRAITMRQGELYSFLSTDDGATFQMEEGVRLVPEDFTDMGVVGLYDPQLIRLSDGRYRIYVTAAIAAEGASVNSHDSARSVIVSATTRLE